MVRQTDGRTDDEQQVIRKAHLNLRIGLAKNDYKIEKCFAF